MKLRNLFFSALCLMTTGAVFTACEDDENNENGNDNAEVVLPKQRVFILNEGIYSMNNANVSFYNPATGEVIDDIYAKQNGGLKLGDTAQDMIEYNGDIYVVMNGSSYITRLSGAGVELARYAFTEEQGQPRYVVAEDGKLYVTLYSGNVARLDAKTLAFEKMVAVGNNPEQLVEEDGKLYVVNSGWGYDNRLSIIDLRTFESAEHVEIMTNPQRIIEVNDRIFIQGYGAAYPDPYTYPVQLYDRQTKTVSTIGQGTHMAAYGDKLYVAYCSTADWVNYTTTFYTYDTRTGQKNETSFLKDAPTKLTTGNVYLLEVNPMNGDIYVGVTYYEAGEGDIYRFKADGTFVETFESGGQGPNAMVFF